MLRKKTVDILHVSTEGSIWPSTRNPNERLQIINRKDQVYPKLTLNKKGILEHGNSTATDNKRKNTHSGI